MKIEPTSFNQRTHMNISFLLRIIPIQSVKFVRFFAFALFLICSNITWAQGVNPLWEDAQVLRVNLKGKEVIVPSVPYSVTGKYV